MAVSRRSDASEYKAGGDASPKRQSSTSRAQKRELELKRARGEASCAECRRLKLKCNKKVPCATCLRRGCHAICPNGMLTTGRGTRFVLANTSKLHEKLLEMSQRIRQLEDALQIAHACISEAPHPLLSQEQLSVKSGVDELSREVEKEEASEDEDQEEEIVTALGSLAVSQAGVTRFIGRVGADTLLLNEPGDDVNENVNTNLSADAENLSSLPNSLMQVTSEFPLSEVNLPKEQFYALIEKHLPSYDRATALAEAYLENVAWFPQPIERDQIMEDLFPFLYKSHRAKLSDLPDEDSESTGMQRMHNLALTLAVFACGAAADLTQLPNNAEGMLYRRLALASLGDYSIIGHGASLETVQAMALISQYDLLACTTSLLESSWKIFSFGLVLAVSIGLHRDPAHWNMEPKDIQRRRTVFWEMFSLSKWMSLGTGRPSVFHLQEMDCKFPDDGDAIVGDDGKTTEGPRRWRQRFVMNVIGPISEYQCLARPIKYSEIMEFDKKIREYPDPPIHAQETDDLKTRMWGINKDIALLFIHRNYFARAMIEQPENPLRGPFSPSFLAAYACAIKLLRSLRVCFEQDPALILRIWPFWAHCLTSAVIIGCVASRSRQLQLATAAFQDFGPAISIFQKANIHPFARRGLPILLRLRERASIALQNLATEAELSSSGLVVPKVEIDETEELNILRGDARLLYRPAKKATAGHQLGSDSPSQPSSRGDVPTPEYGGVLNSSSLPGILGYNPDMYERQLRDVMPSAPSAFPSDFDAVSISQISSYPTGPAPSIPVERELEVLLSTINDQPVDSLYHGPLGFNPHSAGFPPEMKQDNPFVMGLPSYGNGAAVSQARTESLSAMLSNSWPDEASQPGLTSAGVSNDSSMPFGSMFDAYAMNVPFDDGWEPRDGF